MTREIYILKCLNCRERDTAESREEAERKAAEHLSIGEPGLSFPRPGLGHGSHVVVFWPCTEVTA